nr:hypothetical protein [Lachnospiraceae bacterium]
YPDKEGNFNEIISYDKSYYLPHAGMNISFSVKKLKKNELIPKNNYTKWFDCDKIYNVISIRNQKPEDYFVFNTSGNTKKLDDYYKNNKIKRDVRKTIPLITDGNHVMWILGHRTSEAYRVTENTERVLEVSVRFEE